MKFCTDIHVPMWLSSSNVGKPLTFNLAPLSGQNFNLFNMIYVQIPAKLRIFPTASTVLCLNANKQTLAY